MSLTEAEWNRMDKRFDTIDQAAAGFRKEFTEHVRHDDETARTLADHVKYCKAKDDERNAWRIARYSVIGGIIAVLLGVLATSIANHVELRAVHAEQKASTK